MKNQALVTALIAIAAAAGGTAFADEGVAFKLEPAFVSTVTRAQVQAEVLQARKDGTLQVIGDADKPVVFESKAARSDVRAQAVQSVRNHVVNVDQLGS